ncbi:MAG: hypothetical protein J1E58_08740 [Prevotella sp.]|nr:hypothetical protein [Prevotella sp.]
MRFLATILFSCCLGSAVAQGTLADSLRYRMETQATFSGGDYTPLWLNANKHGLSSLDTSNGYIRGAVERPLSADDGKTWGLGYGVDVAVAAGFTSTLIVQQAYVEGRWKKGTLTIGAKEQPMELKNQELSTGSQTFGINARPIPEVRIALPEYWTIPGLHDWLALKGHIAYGKPTDDHWQKDFVKEHSRYTEGALHHSKAGYLKIGPKKLTLELGLEMASQFGGKSYRETERDVWEIVPNEGGLKGFWHALMPGGGDAGEGMYGNFNGNQLGSWMARLNYETDGWEASLYADHFFEDHSSMFMMDYDGYGEGEEWEVKKDNKYLLYDFKDIMLGFEFRKKGNAILNDVVVEYIYSKYQSGPVYHDRTPAFSDHIGGNDNYYNHYIFTGWQHWGQVMGNPLYRSPLYNSSHEIRVENNRFVAWHLGLAGQPNNALHYRVLATYQTGYGTYDDPFTAKQYNLSLLAEVSYQLRNNWALRGAWAMDRGKLLGDNQGIQLTITKSGLLTK